MVSYAYRPGGDNKCPHALCSGWVERYDHRSAGRGLFVIRTSVQDSLLDLYIRSDIIRLQIKFTSSTTHARSLWQAATIGCAIHLTVKHSNGCSY
jgi:hypothetical protein